MPSYELLKKLLRILAFKGAIKRNNYFCVQITCLAPAQMPSFLISGLFSTSRFEVGFSG
jgi:hypothetical protein